MRVLTCNVNGIRSAADKGFIDWMRRQSVDVVCLQEVRAHPEQMALRLARPRGFHALYRAPARKGYSGVGVWSRQEPLAVDDLLGDSAWDPEGRYLAVRLPGCWIASLYLPSGSAGPERQQRKMGFLDVCYRKLEALRALDVPVLICGDWNIAHRPIDLENWRSNQRNSGFLPEERVWLDRVFDDLGYVDVFRKLDPRPKQYTWWSNRGRAREKNVGWRIDYHIATPSLAERATHAFVHRRSAFSDHAPLVVDYDM
ncbi:MAG: exodeoxyribonuclease III [Myxococcales bacterium]|nr:exodeoxyribonuclease III [Myxococcales bacterium]